jgi:hypothetical protein
VWLRRAHEETDLVAYDRSEAARGEVNSPTRHNSAVADRDVLQKFNSARINLHSKVRKKDS